MSNQKKSSNSKIILAVLLLLFLLGGGYFIAIFSTDSARQIGSGKDYDKLSKNSDVYSSKVATSNDGDAFFDKNDISNIQNSDISEDEMNDTLLRASAKEQARENMSKGSSLSMASSIAAERINNTSVDFSSIKNSGKKYEESSESGGEMVLGSNTTKYKSGSSVFDRLRTALALSQDAVNDITAEGSTEKMNNAFGLDLQAESALGIMTGGGGSTATDVGDLNSLPKFLRAQEDLEKTTVSDSKVGSMDNKGEYDPDETKTSVEKVPEPTKFDKAVNTIFPGMMNPIFMGFIPHYEPPERSPYEIAYSNLGNGRPEDLPSMLSIDDENLIVYGSKKGFQVVFDMEGNFIGCMDNVTQFFKAAGTPGCPR